MDILGFKNDINQKWNKEKKQLIKKITSLKKHILVKQVNPLSLPKKFQKDVFQKTTRLFTFSDSFIICIQDNPNSFNLGVLGIISYLGNIWRELIKYGYTIRGAIDFGDIYWDITNVFGPALITAYELESKCAKTSRVIISSSFNNKLKEMMQPNPPNNIHLENVILKCFLKDVDGYIIFNPQCIYSDKNDKEKVIKKLEQAQSNGNNTIKKEKYVPLLNILKENKRIISEIKDFGNY